jgi:hypothetical protein
MRTFPSPFSMRGEFEITGIELAQLTTIITQSELATEVSKCSSSQLEHFFGLQKSMER